MKIFDWIRTKLPPVWSVLSMVFAPMANMIGLFPEKYRPYFSNLPENDDDRVVGGVIVGRPFVE